MKKIITAVALSLVAIVCITALVLSLIKVGGNTVIDMPSEVYITGASTKGNERDAYHLGNRSQDRGKIEAIYNALDNGFKQSMLESLFKGQNKAAEAYYEPQAGDLDNQMDKNFSTSKRFTVYFYYPQAKSIRVGTRDLLYQYIFFEVSSENTMALVTFGVNSTDRVDVSSDNSDTVANSTGYKFSYKAYANLSEMYHLISTWDLTA